MGKDSPNGKNLPMEERNFHHGEMYSITDSVILAHTPDYHVNLIAPKEMSDDEINEFHSNLWEVMLYIKYSKDKQTLNKAVMEDIKFQHMERQAAEVMMPKIAKSTFQIHLFKVYCLHILGVRKCSITG